MSKDTIYREDAIKVVRHASIEFVDADTRQKLIEAVPSADRPSDPHDITYVNALKNRIRELEAKRPQGWIPCGERLPKAEEKVWIQTKRGKVCFAMYEDGTISEVDSDWHWYDLDFENWDEENDCGIIPEGWWEWTEFHPDNEFDCPVDEVVVAWMPIPNPLKGADDETD